MAQTGDERAPPCPIKATISAALGKALAQQVLDSEPEILERAVRLLAHDDQNEQRPLPLLERADEDARARMGRYAETYAEDDRLSQGPQRAGCGKEQT